MEVDEVRTLSITSNLNYFTDKKAQYQPTNKVYYKNDKKHNFRFTDILLPCPQRQNNNFLVRALI